jgi:hypothetical protein
MEIKFSKSLLRTIVLFVLFVNVAFAQNFVESICTLKSGRQIQGLLKNDFKDTDEFLFIREGEQLTQIKAADIELLLINGVEKYTSQLIDFHPNALLSLKEVSVIRDVNFDARSKKQVLLKILVEGDVDLLQSQINGIALYYIKGNAIEGLEYLQNYKYYNEQNFSVQQNSFFRRQLYRTANCSENSINKFEYVSYDEKDLVKVINEHNICKGSDSKILKKKSSFKESLRFSVLGGVKFYQGAFSSSLFFNSGQLKDTHVSPNIGTELAFVVPNRKRNSELFSRLSYSNIKLESVEKTAINSGVTVIEEGIKYETNLLEVALGYRYYINSLEEKNNFGFDFSFNFAFPLNPFVEKSFSNTGSAIPIIDYSDDIEFTTNASLGLSYIFKTRFIFEARYTFQSDFMSDTPVSAEFSNFNLNFRYLFF